MTSSLPNKTHYAILTDTVLSLSMRTVTAMNNKRAQNYDKHAVRNFYTEQCKL